MSSATVGPAILPLRRSSSKNVLHWSTEYTCAEIGDLLPNDSYDPEKGFGWTPATAYDFARVRLKIVPDDNGSPKAVIDYYFNGQGTFVDLRGVSGVAASSQSVDEIFRFHARNRNGRKTHANTRDVWIGDEWINGRLVFAEAHDVYDGSVDALPVAITEPTYNWDTPVHLEMDTDTVLDWCDTPEWAEMMLTDACRFVPAFEVSGRGTPFPNGSIAHALFSNLHINDSGERLDRAFLRHVRRTAQIGLEWYVHAVRDEGQPRQPLGLLSAAKALLNEQSYLARTEPQTPAAASSFRFQIGKVEDEDTETLFDTALLSATTSVNGELGSRWKRSR